MTPTVKPKPVSCWLEPWQIEMLLALELIEPDGRGGYHFTAEGERKFRESLDRVFAGKSQERR